MSRKFALIPAIDLKNGQCVRLRQGRIQESTLFYKNPLDAAKHWSDCGTERLHIVDLDGAFAAEPVNQCAHSTDLRSITTCTGAGGWRNS